MELLPDRPGPPGPFPRASLRTSARTVPDGPGPDRPGAGPPPEPLAKISGFWIEPGSLGGFGQKFDRNDRSCAAITAALTIKLCGKRLPLRMGAAERRGPSRARARVRAGSFRGWKATEVAGAKNTDFDQTGAQVYLNRRFARGRVLKSWNSTERTID